MGVLKGGGGPRGDLFNICKYFSGMDKFVCP